jgi:hypothetical protein
MYLQLQLIWMSNKLAIKFSLPFVAVTVVATSLQGRATACGFSNILILLLPQLLHYFLLGMLVGRKNIGNGVHA